MMFYLVDASRIVRFDYAGIDYDAMAYVLLLIGIFVWLLSGVLQVVKVYVKV